MAPRTRHRPRRGGGDSDPLIAGDSGTYAGPQGGALPGPYETGDLESREFGVPQADIPGGKQHIVNAPTHPVRPGPEDVEVRPADLHKFHGVEPHDLGQYVTPPDATQDQDAPKPEPEPQITDAVPVYIVESPESKVIRKNILFNINVGNSTTRPVRICGTDPNRVEIQVLNEDSATDIRICETEAGLQLASAQGTGPAGDGALIWHGTNSYTRIRGQGELYALTTSATASARLSVIIITEGAA
jgi:hypothetical protein